MPSQSQHMYVQRTNWPIFAFMVESLQDIWLWLIRQLPLLQWYRWFYSCQVEPGTCSPMRSPRSKIPWTQKSRQATATNKNLWEWIIHTGTSTLIKSNLILYWVFHSRTKYQSKLMLRTYSHKALAESTEVVWGARSVLYARRSHSLNFDCVWWHRFLLIKLS